MHARLLSLRASVDGNKQLTQRWEGSEPRDMPQGTVLDARAKTTVHS